MENLILRYGINQLGAYCRDGSLDSFDFTFKTIEDAEKYYYDMCNCGYGNRYHYPVAITLEDELRIDIEKALSNEDFLTDKTISNILSYYKKRFDIEVDSETWNKIMETI